MNEREHLARIKRHLLIQDLDFENEIEFQTHGQALSLHAFFLVWAGCKILRFATTSSLNYLRKKRKIDLNLHLPKKTRIELLQLEILLERRPSQENPITGQSGIKSAPEQILEFIPQANPN